MLVPQINLRLETLWVGVLVDRTVGEVVDGLVLGWLLGQTGVQGFDFLLLLFDFFLFPHQELLQSLKLILHFVLLIILAMSMLYRLLELRLEYNQLVHGLILFLLNFPVNLSHPLQLIGHFFHLDIKRLILLFLFLFLFFLLLLFLFFPILLVIRL